MSFPVGSHEGIETYVAHRTSQEKRPGGRGGAVPATKFGIRSPDTGGPCPISPRFGDPSRRGVLAVYWRCTDYVGRIRSYPLILGGVSSRS